MRDALGLSLKMSSWLANKEAKGFGKELMAFAFDLAKEKGYYKAQLLSGPNEDQVGFYRSLGMQDGTSQGFKKYFIER
jgi:GNAT superfamily N-acetyltransferase